MTNPENNQEKVTNDTTQEQSIQKQIASDFADKIFTDGVLINKRKSISEESTEIHPEQIINSTIELTSPERKLSTLNSKNSYIDAEGGCIYINENNGSIIDLYEASLQVVHSKDSNIKLETSSMRAGEVTSTTLELNDAYANIGNLNHSNVKMNKSTLEAGYLGNSRIEMMEDRINCIKAGTIADCSIKGNGRVEAGVVKDCDVEEGIYLDSQNIENCKRVR